MSDKLDNFIDSMVTMADENKGLALVETWTCVKCHHEVYAIHQMQEVIRCPVPGCGHRHASALPRYQSACEIGADTR